MSLISKKWLAAYLLTLFLGFSSTSVCVECISSYPYISGDTFRAYSDFTYDDRGNLTDPSLIQKGNTVFIKTRFLGKFFKDVHPYIKHPYIIITHNHDLSIPGQYDKYLDDEKIIAWFGINIERCVHPKLHPIPIGIANAYHHYNNIQVLNTLRPQLKDIPKSTLLYMNFTIASYPLERRYVYNLFIEKPWCKSVAREKFDPYANDVAGSMFVLSPRGVGIDCYRTWEALLLGAIPIVKTSYLDPLFDELPVLIVDDWSILTKEYLEQTYSEMILKSYNTDKLFADYWFALIDSYKNY